jgi:small-conductance mechanosensitive channel
LFYIDPNWDTPGPVAISKANDAIKKAFDKNDINIPYPHTVVTVDKNDQNLLKTLLFLKKK